uniref:Putative RNA-directed DNA polymerase n=1 Tax=Sipha flava TaxID=143950 RepID=A0A2S2QCP3_9HEMI
MLRLFHFPLIFKFSIVILIHKPGKPKHLQSSYRPISLLPVLAKLFEKMILKRIRPIINSKNIIPHTQFGFRSCHSTIHQIHRLTDKIQTSFENKEYCPGVFLDLAQALDRVWHDGLLYKFKSFLPAPYYLIILSYLCDRTFAVRQGDSTSSYFPISAGVPQGSDLSPDLFNIYTSDIPKINKHDHSNLC